MNNIKILLINPPPWGVHNPPIGLGYVSQSLLDRGFEHDVFDLNLELFLKVPENQKHFWHMNNKNLWGNKDTFEMIIKENKLFLDELLSQYNFEEYSTIGFSVVEPRELITNYICEYILERNKNIVFFAGNVATSNKDRRNTMKYIKYGIPTAWRHHRSTRRFA